MSCEQLQFVAHATHAVGFISPSGGNCNCGSPGIGFASECHENCDDQLSFNGCDCRCGCYPCHGIAGDISDICNPPAGHTGKLIYPGSVSGGTTAAYIRYDTFDGISIPRYSDTIMIEGGIQLNTDAHRFFFKAQAFYPGVPSPGDPYNGGIGFCQTLTFTGIKEGVIWPSSSIPLPNVSDISSSVSIPDTGNYYDPQQATISDIYVVVTQRLPNVANSNLTVGLQTLGSGIPLLQPMISVICCCDESQ